MRLAENIGRKNRQKIAICAPSHNFVWLYLRNCGAYRQSEKQVKQQYISHICSQYGKLNFGRLAAEIGSVVLRTPANFNGFRVLALLLQRRRSTKANQSLHDVSPSPGLVSKYIYIFGGSCPITEFCQVQNSPSGVLRSPILAALPHGTRVVSVRQTLRRCAESATYIRQGGYHVGHWPTF